MWTEEKLNQYITDKVEESLYLDYKAADSLSSSDGKKNEIAKDVSAFANSDGGVIIYGIKEYQSGTDFLPEKIDPVNRQTFSKETLEQIINSRISPKIHGVVITPVSLSNGNGNSVVYVVEIPKGMTAHQASDKRYYRRYNFQSISMDDWEIKDIINRQNRTLAEIMFQPDSFTEKHFSKLIKEKNMSMSFDIRAVNIGNRVIEYCDCIITGNKQTAEFIKPTPNIRDGEKYFELYFTNEIEHKITIEENESIVNIQRMAITPETFRKIGEIVLYSDFFLNNCELKVTLALDDNRITRKIKGTDLVLATDA